MMAHLTQRQKFSNGGDAILPQPNPLSPQERNQKVFYDFVGRMKHYLTGADMPEWFVKDLILKKAEELGVELKASGGKIGGGVIEGTNLGDRTGFAEIDIGDRKTRSVNTGVTKIGKPVTVSENVKKITYLDKATNKKITIYKALILDRPADIGGKMTAGIGGDYKNALLKDEFRTLEEAQDAVTNYRKKNPKNIPLRDPEKVYITKDKRISAIKAGEGVESYKAATSGSCIQKGHATNIWNPDAKIKPKDIIYTPTDINQAMAGNTSASKAVDLDYKIEVAENKINEIKKSNMSKAKKKIELGKLDDKLMKYVDLSDGYKTVTLSNNKSYGEVFQKSSSMDMFDEFSKMSEKDTKAYVRKYFTESGKLKPEWTKGKISNIDKEGIKKSYVFLENVKNAQNNAIRKAKYLEALKQKSKKSGLFGKFAKGLGKVGLRTVGAAIPFIGPAMVGWGVSDVAKAAEMGLTNEELAIAYGAGPEIAEMWSDLKPKMKQNIEDMTVKGNIYEGDKRGYPVMDIEEQEEVVTANKPTYGPYADQIKKLKIS